MNILLTQQLADIATLLHGNHMPQEMINLVLASRCGLPMKPIDPMSPAYPWVDDSTSLPPEQNSEVESSEERFRRLCNGVLRVMKEATLSEGLDVLACAADRFASGYGHAARVIAQKRFGVEGAANG